MTRNRKIFEDVGGSKNQSNPLDIVSQASQTSSETKKEIRIFLVCLFVLVLGMVFVGGLTRQTDSGLSITVWEPVRGFIPPITAADWESEFSNYQETAEFKLVNNTMQLADFKVIYWWEWGHRQLGRIVGIVFIMGFSWLYFTRQINQVWSQRLLLLGGLGLFQGIVGWWMVTSGLQATTTDVASYRLATHLTISVLILVLIYWNFLKTRIANYELLQARRYRERRIETASMVMIVALFLQGILGALMAGIDAGLGFPTWPLMNGEFLPSNSFDYSPWILNFIQNPSLVHFNHRMVGYLIVLAGLWVFFISRISPYAKTRQFGLLGKITIIVQIIFGIATVLTSVSMGLAVLHQLWAILIMIIYVNLLFCSRYPEQKSVRKGN
ncbi:MAG: COX15/CtaA family protein [Rhodobacteraceae bacterium]|nr:COX15/CtaA family protein [Paracoccaceae bacterium]